MTTDTVLSLPEAEALVEQTKAAIDRETQTVQASPWCAADLKRLDLALEGLRDCWRLERAYRVGRAVHARRYSTLIVDTAALYGQTP